MEYPMYLDRQQIGVIRVTPEGEDMRFSVLAVVPPGLYRVYVVGSYGEFLLGVWEGGELSRRFSSELTAGTGQIRRAYARASREDNETWSPALPDYFSGWPVEGGICRRRGKRWQLAMPFGEEKPFPLPPLFCLARVGEMMGGRWAYFWFDDGGRPILPPGE